MRIMTKLVLAFIVVGTIFPQGYDLRYKQIVKMQNIFAFFTYYGLQSSNHNLAIRDYLNKIKIIAEEDNHTPASLAALNEYSVAIKKRLSDWNYIIRFYLTHSRTPANEIEIVKRDLNDDIVISNEIVVYLNRVKQSIGNINPAITRNELERNFESINSQLYRIDQTNIRNMTTYQNTIYQLFDMTRILSTLFVLIGFLLLFITLIKITTSIIAQLSILKEAAEKIIKKDYRINIVVDRDDELGQLSQDFNEIAISLERSNKYIESIINTMPSILLVTNPDLEIKKTNKTASSVLGFSVAELESNNLNNLVPAHYHSQLSQMARSNHIKLYNHQYEEIPVLLSSEQLKNVETNEDETVYIAQDIALLEAMQQQAIKSARLAGMGEIATSVMHTVGNILNSLSVSISLVDEKISGTKIQKIIKLAEMLQAKGEQLSEYLEQDNNVDVIHKYLNELNNEWLTDKALLLGEIQNITRHIDEINNVIRAQQAMYKQIGMIEETSIKSVFDEAVTINGGMLSAAHVQIDSVIDSSRKIKIDKFKLLQVLAFLIKNAIQSYDALQVADKKIKLRLVEKNNDFFSIVISYKGAPLPPDYFERNGTLDLIDNEHDFGLHLCTLDVALMGGMLTVTNQSSDSAVYITIDLPYEPNEKKVGH